MTDKNQEAKAVTPQRSRSLGRLPRLIFLILTPISIGMAVLYVFGYSFLGYALIQWQYYCLLIAIYLPFVLLLFPAKKGGSGRIPFYDFVLAGLAFGIPLYFSFHVIKMMEQGWSLWPSTPHFIMAFILTILVLESARRIGGPVYFMVCLIIGACPLYAEFLPGMLAGKGFPLTTTIGYLGFGPEGYMGLPMKVIGDILIGFLLFASLLIYTGAGKFFLNFAMGLLGHVRGGPAKVAVLSSALFGSMSGSIFSNIVATGSITIPTMKRIGYPAHYAGAVEACASTGGVLMPPIMGAVAFVMASLLEIPYATIIIAAFVPSVLYYTGLLLQVDAYAARVGLRGVPREELPSMRETLKEGWHYIAVLVFLLWGLIYMKWEYLTPYYASVLLIILAVFRRETRIGPRKAVDIIDGLGRLITETLGIILPIALVVSGLVITGLAPALTAGIIWLGRGVPMFGLILGAVVCYIMGMAGLAISAYIFLAITLAPSLVLLGFDLFCVHLFIIYYSMLSAITPPVAAGAFLASNIAGAPPMKTAWTAVRLGVVIYFIPFFFVFNPSLVLRGSLLEGLYLFFFCLVGIVLIAGGVEGYLLKVGLVRLWARPLLVIAGLLIGFPEWMTTIAGAILAVAIIGVMLIERRKTKNLSTTS